MAYYFNLCVCSKLKDELTTNLPACESINCKIFLLTILLSRTLTLESQTLVEECDIEMCLSAYLKVWGIDFSLERVCVFTSFAIVKRHLIKLFTL